MKTSETAFLETAVVHIPSIPPFAIFVRSGCNDASAAWTLFGTALSEEQSRSKLADYSRTYGQYEFRSMPNDWKKDERESALELEVSELRLFKKEIVKRCGTDDIDVLAKGIKEAHDLPKQVAQHKARAETAVKDLLEATGGAPEGDPVVPFKVGELVQDVHTKIKMTVTAVGRDCAPIGRNKTPAYGFDWEAAGGLTGHCPIASVECYHKVKTSATAKSKPKKHS